tara:strand:- start:1411 stop:2454 length:1044 start_codon:yes stop_codon:yes gene_type:complete
MEKVLIVAPSWLGDLVIAQSLFKKLYKDGCEIHVAAPNWNKDILNFMPEVKSTILLPFEHGELSLLKRYKFAKTLSCKKYDKSIILPNSLKSALLPYFANIPNRVGYIKEGRGIFLTDRRKLNKEFLPLMVQRFNYLGEQEKKLSSIINVNKEYYPKLDTSNINYNLLQEKFNINFSLGNSIAIAPGAAFGPAKRWPKKYYAHVAKEYLNKGFNLFIVGASQDSNTAQNIIDIINVNNNYNDKIYNLTGKLSLTETVSVLAKSTFLITNDSGLMHVAAALNLAAVAIYGSTSQKFTPPLNDKCVALYDNNISCRPCFARTCKYGHYKCLYKITPDMVLRELDKLWQD